MAEERKSIEISYKANLNELIAKLKQIPNITDQEAKKMVAAFDRQMKQTEKASQKAAKASKIAAQQAAAAARRGSKEFDNMEYSARRAEETFGKVAETSGDIDRGFSSVGLALRNVNPQLAEAADGLADTFAVTEGLTMSFKTLNPIIIAAAVVIGGLTLGYQSYQEELKRTRERIIAVREAQKSLDDSNEAIRKNLEDSFQKLRDQEIQYKHTTGAISDYEMAQYQATRTTRESFQGNIDAQEAIIAKRQEDLKLIQRVKAGSKAITEEEKERLKELQYITPLAKNNVDLMEKSLWATVSLDRIQDELNRRIGHQEAILDKINETKEKAVDIALKNVELEKEYSDAAEENAELEKKKAENAEKAAEAAQRAAEAAQREKQVLADIDAFYERRAAFEQSLLENREKLSQELIKISGSEIDNINLKYDLEIERLKELSQKAEETAGVQEAIDNLEAERKQEIHSSRMKQLEDEQKKSLEIASSTTDAYSDMLHGIADLVEQNSKDEAAAAQKAFQLRKAAALAETSMNTAKGIVNALATYPGPIGIGLASSIGAAGLIQGAVIASQQPPSYHMGGFANDEMGARVLKGEAVLDRATVRRIGGEEGVKQLQQGSQGNSNVVVVQPFKHFGRFAREIGFKPTKRTGIRGY